MRVLADRQTIKEPNMSNQFEPAKPNVMAWATELGAESIMSGPAISITGVGRRPI